TVLCRYTARSASPTALRSATCTRSRAARTSTTDRTKYIGWSSAGESSRLSPTTACGRSARRRPHARSARVAWAWNARKTELDRLPAGLDGPHLAGFLASGGEEHCARDLFRFQQRKTLALDRVPELAVDHRRIGDPRSDGVDADATLRQLRGGTPHEADHCVLGERVDRIAVQRRQSGERCGRDDRAAAFHHLRQPANAEHDTVDVRCKYTPVRVVRQPRHVAFAGHDARVETGELDRVDAFPRTGIR